MAHLLVLLLLLVPAWASAQSPPALSAADALEIRALLAERDLFRAQFQLQQQQAEAEYQKKRQAVIDAIERAAKNSGVSLSEGWMPDPEARVWTKPKEAPK